MTTWQFDSHIADIFVQHARQHIPRYDEVIDQSVEICNLSLDKTDKIIDVGCATGETLKRLHQAGFNNLVGVDSSEPMLDRCRGPVPAQLIYSSDFPIDHGPYSAILCNWTLHFVKDKISYLQKIYQSLEPSGLLILSEKTANQGIELELYHNYKRQQGVSEQAIIDKARSVQDIMFINSVEWYQLTLSQLGFETISIVNASPCFTTFLCYKQSTI